MLCFYCDLSEFELIQYNIAPEAKFRNYRSMETLEQIEQRLRSVDASIRQLTELRQQLIRLRNQHYAIEPTRHMPRVTAASKGKLQTLGDVIAAIQKHGKPLSTTKILRELKERGNETNPTTIRSHLRRLKADKAISYEPDGGLWSIPAPKEGKE